MENQKEQIAQNAETKNKSILERLRLNSRIIKIAAPILAVLLIAVVGYYFYNHGKTVYTDNAEISAPLIALSPSQAGILQDVLVKEGDLVSARDSVAKMDNGLVKAETDGIVVGVDNEVGKLFSPGESVVTMINPDDLRVVAHIEENKGLDLVKVGQKVTFTVDAFGSKKFYGTVDEIAKTADQSSVVFSISDKRAENDFSVKIKYDVHAYPQLLNGMSAKVWIEVK